MIRKLLLIVSLFVLPIEQVQAKGCKKVCCLNVTGNEVVCGSLAVGCALTLTGRPLVSSIIPFSSGVIALATDLPLGLSAAGLLIGFGSSNASNVTLLPAPLTTVVSQTGFAFTVPQAGTLHNLQVSVDGVYPIGLAAISYTFNFTLYHSSCVNGTLTAYSSTGLTASATLSPQVAGGLTLLAPGFTGCGSSAGSIQVAQGDRIVLSVTPVPGTGVVLPIIAAALADVSFSAGVMYTPLAI